MGERTMAESSSPACALLTPAAWSCSEITPSGTPRSRFSVAQRHHSGATSSSAFLFAHLRPRDVGERNGATIERLACTGEAAASAG